METKTIGERIAALLKTKNMKQVEYAALTGFTTKHISNIIRGVVGSIPLETLDVLAKPLGVDRFYLQGLDKHEPVPDIVIGFDGNMPELEDRSLTAVPVCRSRVAASPEVVDFVDTETVGYVAIQNHKNLKRLKAFKVTGDSMSPYILEGDIAVIQENNGMPYDYLCEDTIYLCEIFDDFGNYGLSLKKARIIDKRFLVLISLNPAYKTKVIDMKGLDKYPILGKLIQSIREW